MGKGKTDKKKKKPKRFRTSAGLFLYRGEATSLEVLIGHPGGPFFKKKDDGAWTVLKGEYDPEAEDARVAAGREFEEESGVAVPDGEWIDLGEITQKGGKKVRAFAVRGDIDVATVQSNTFDMEWPPKSGRTVSFPEIDRVLYADVETAKRKLKSTQCPFIDRLVEALDDA